MRQIRRIALFAILLTVHTTFRAQISFGKPELINNQWYFHLGDEQEASDHNYDVSKWRMVDLPHDWSIEEPLSPSLASCQGFLPGGIGWYRKTLFIPQNKCNERAFLYFEGIYNRSEVFVNGQSLGKRPNGYISFAYDITPFLQYEKENSIAIRVDHSQSADSRWYTGSGIYRNVWLVYSNPVHIAQWGVFAHPVMKMDRNWDLSVETEIANQSNKNTWVTIVQELFSPEGKMVVKNSKKISVSSAKSEKTNVELHVKNPLLWNIDTPIIYTLKTTILQNGEKIDETTTNTGFRSFVFDPDSGFLLNGKNVKMKGVCIHHDAGVLGAAVPREVWKRRLQTLKEIGINAIRTSHNPQAPDVYDLCDEIGILVLNEAYDEWEFPKNKWIRGWNTGTPGHQGSFDIFEKWGEKDLIDMVRRDRNHVSVFAWSIGNEVDYPNDPYSHPVLDGDNKDFTQKLNGGYKKDAPDANRLGGIAKRLALAVKQFDRSRPVTAGLAGVAMSNETEYPLALDIAGYNYTESRYVFDHKKYPKRVIFGSETRHDIEAWKAVTDNDHIFGQFIWTGIDYLGESGEWPSRGFYSGLVDFAGFIKPRGYFRKALWTEEPMAYLGTYPNFSQKSEPSMDAWPIWNYNEGQIVRVVCYTNTDRAQLFLDDKPIGDMKDYDEKTGIIFWDIPFHEGKLEVKGYKGEIETACYAIETSGRPNAISAVTDKKQLKKEKDLTHIVLQIVDKNGIPVLLSDDEIKCEIEGPAKLLGMENGNNSDMSDYTDNIQRVFHGRLLVYIQTTGQEGEIKVIFSAPWLKPVEVNLRSTSN